MKASWLDQVTGCTLIFCAALALLQLGGPAVHRPEVVLGQDADWHVKDWSAEHKRAVESGHAGKTSVHNIWLSPDQAWNGIDDILPTGSSYAYQNNHLTNANQGKLLDYMKMVRSNLRKLGEKLPVQAPESLTTQSPAKFEQRMNEIKDVLDSESTSFSDVEKQASFLQGCDQARSSS